MRAALRALALGLALAVPSGATAATQGCADQWAFVANLMGIGAAGAPVFSVTAEGCTARDVDLTHDAFPNMAFKINRVHWSGTRLDQLDAGLPPTRLALKAVGVRTVVRSGNLAMDWVFDKQSVRATTNVDLLIAWNAETKVLALERFEIDLPGADALRASARVAGVDLSDAFHIGMSAGTFAVVETYAEIETYGLFERFALSALAPVSTTQDLDAELLRLKDTARGGIATVPDRLLPPASKSALQRLIDAVPHPNGRITVRTTADPGIGMARGLALSRGFDPDGLDKIWGLLEGIRVDITYVHEPME